MIFRRSNIAVVLFGLLAPLVSMADAEYRYLTVAIGHVAAFDGGIDDPIVYKVEYRFEPRTKWLLAPSLGAAKSENGASFVFIDDGRDIRLGHELEFRSGIKISYEFDSKWRVGVGLFHLSNGGLADRNPGTEPVFLGLSVPL